MKIVYAYSPHTGEFINTELPSDWMLTTDIAPPAYDPQTAGLFFRDNAWAVEVSKPDTEQLAKDARAQRDAKITAVDWRYTRHAREVRLGLTPTDDIAALDTYVQALADISKQSGFPDAVVWAAL